MTENSKIKDNNYEYDEDKYEDELYDRLDELFVVGAKKTITRLKSKGIPVALYDLEKEKVYLEYPDGHREYPN
ncbi:MAG: hypothetical protein SOY48_05995 [Eubacterium sp.]|nr:hypothetical protein [Eubacterium sp.]